MLARYNIIRKTSKIGLIALLVLCILVIGFSSISVKDSALSVHNLLPPANLVLKSEATVGKPIFSSSGKNSYKISAEKIIKNADGVYNMTNISGVYNLENNQNITVTSDLGSINNYQDLIKLNNYVKIGYQDYVLLSEKIDLDLRTKSAESKVFVQIIGSDGSISADKFQTTEEFDQITFDGNVAADFNISSNN